MSDGKSNIGVILALAAAGALAIFMLPKLSRANVSENTQITAGGTQIVDSTTGQIIAQKTTVALKDIPGAQWKVPLYVTIERDIQLGFWSGLVGIAQSAGGAIVSGTATAGTAALTALKTAGSAVGTAISGISGVVTGTVVPSVTSITGKLASVVTAVPGYVGNAGSAIFDLAKSGGSTLWSAVTGATKYAVQNPEQIKQAVSTVSAVAGTVMAIKDADKSQVATTPAEAQQQQSEVPSAQTFVAGTLSQTAFNTEFGPSLIIKKLYNPQLKDTVLVTNEEAVLVLGEVGYQFIENIGYCSPGPFIGSTPMIMLYNENTVDHLLITNPNAVAQFEAAGYKSLGTIGYCKAVEVS